MDFQSGSQGCAQKSYLCFADTIGRAEIKCTFKRNQLISLVLFVIWTHFFAVYADDLIDQKPFAPDFLIIGAQKCGTSALHDFLNAHPMVQPVKNEIHYFDLNFYKGEEWYKEQIGYKKHSARLLGDKSPYYLFHPLVPRRVAALYPQVKIIIMLRNPVDRAYSHYWHNVFMNREPLSFEEALEAESSRLADETQQFLEDPFHTSFNHRNYSYISRGFYAEQIKQWLSYFPKKQILILFTKDLKTQPDIVMSKVCRFLGISIKTGHPVYVQEKRKYPLMPEETRKKLTELFKPYNQELAELLGIPLPWDK